MDADVEDMLSRGVCGEPNLGRRVVYTALSSCEEYFRNWPSSPEVEGLPPLPPWHSL